MIGLRWELNDKGEWHAYHPNIWNGRVFCFAIVKMTPWIIYPFRQWYLIDARGAGVVGVGFFKSAEAARDRAASL